MKFIKNGRLILKDRILTGKAIAYDDRIIGFVDNDAVPAGAEVIDAAGAYVAPGLIDVHIHGYLGQDVCDCNPDGIRKIAAGIVQNGVTGFLPTTMTVSMDTIEKAIDVCRSLKEESKTWKGTAILGVHAEGPFINPKKKGAQDEKYILKPDAAFVKKNADMIKIITMAPEMDEDFAAIREIVSDTDVVVSMGHTDATYDVAAAGIVNGVRSTTHLFNAMSALGHRNPGVVGAALKYDVYTELIVDTFHVDKSLYSIVGKQKGEKLVFITDCPARRRSAGGRIYARRPAIHRQGHRVPPAGRNHRRQRAQAEQGRLERVHQLGYAAVRGGQLRLAASGHPHRPRPHEGLAGHRQGRGHHPRGRQLQRAENNHRRYRKI